MQIEIKDNCHSLTNGVWQFDGGEYSFSADPIRLCWQPKTYSITCDLTGIHQLLVAKVCSDYCMEDLGVILKIAADSKGVRELAKAYPHFMEFVNRLTNAQQ
jgi:hypothetical protein